MSRFRWRSSNDAFVDWKPYVELGTRRGRALAYGIVTKRGSRCATSHHGTLSQSKFGSSKSTDSCMHIPHSRRLSVSRNVPFDEDCTSLCTLSRNNHIGPLDRTNVTRCSDLDDRLRIIHIGEKGTARHDGCVAFAHYFARFWEAKRSRHLISSCIEEDNYTSRASLVKNALQSASVVGDAIASCAFCFNTNEIGHWLVFVVRLRALIICPIVTSCSE